MLWNGVELAIFWAGLGQGGKVSHFGEIKSPNKMDRENVCIASERESLLSVSLYYLVSCPQGGCVVFPLTSRHRLLLVTFITNPPQCFSSVVCLVV